MRKQSAFTLVELLVVVAIIIILVTLATVNYFDSISKSRDGRRMADLKQLQAALQLYYAENGVYPSSGGGWLSSDPGETNVTSSPTNYIPGLAPKYIRALPKDPKGGAGNATLGPNCSATTAWKSSYLYRSDGQNFVLIAHCSPEKPGWGQNFPFYDCSHPTWAWKVCAGTGSFGCDEGNASCQ